MAIKFEKFDMKDVHSGYVVKFRSGRYGLCMRVGEKFTKIFARVDDSAQITGASEGTTFMYASRYKGPAYYAYNPVFNRPENIRENDIVAVYGLIEGVRNYLNIGDTGPISIKNRPLLWEERPTKKMTLKEIGDALGCNVELVEEKKEVHYKNPETCRKCKYENCLAVRCSECPANLNANSNNPFLRSKCRCNQILRNSECPYFEEK